MRPVKFVSAGPTEPLKLLDVLLDKENDEAEEPASTTSPETHTKQGMQVDTQDESDNEIDRHDERGGHEADVEEDSGEDDHFIGPDELEEAIQAQVEPDNETSEEPSFFFDLKGDQSQPRLQQASVEIPDRPSSRSSSSSEEVILFRGRAAPRKPPQTEEISMVQMQTEIRAVEQAIITEPAPAPHSPAPELTVEPPNRKKLSKKEKKQKQRDKRNARRQIEEEEDATLADYIANMKENSDDEYFRQLLEGRSDDSDGAEEDASDSLAVTSKQQRVSSKLKAVDIGDPDEDQDEDLSEDDEKDEDDEVASEIDDATLARLIAGQELSQDLGMEDVHFGDSSSDSDSSSDNKTKKRQQAIDDDVDLMDWERPSLRRRKGKGAKAQINFNLSDSELEAQLQAAWKTDRQKKSERKKQREELRALGMLGKKADPEDLRVKYLDGMNMEQVAEELRVFLMSSDEQ
ncbi:squalene synthetase-like protein [Fusarium piperis]|uniref:Squalene synthetase-like protein n=1 Tax=Fusarium piperis TaxID=1435070 RepID=A0A9W8T9L9_9HYPO|nr:squalene synthetase-like protein [Fusarium piperis]